MTEQVSDLRRKVDVRLAVLRMTKAELAKACGQSPQGLNGMLNQGNPRAKMLAKIAAALGVGVEVFFEDGVPASLLQVDPAAPAKKERRKKADA